MAPNQNQDSFHQMRSMKSKKLEDSRRLTVTARILAVVAAIYSDSRLAGLLQGLAAAILMILVLAISLPALWFQYYSRNIGGSFAYYHAVALLSGLYVSFLMYHLASLIPLDLIWLILCKILRINVPHKIFSFFACLSGISITAYGRRHALKLKTAAYDLRTPKWKAEDGYRIVQLSDLHIGSIIDEKYIAKVVDQTNRLNPDLVVITGDIFNRVSANEISHPERAFQALSKIRATDGVYAVRGNHDPDLNHPIWQQFLSQSGIQDLDNACVSAGPLRLAGRTGLAGDSDRKALKEVFSGSDASRYTVILDHDPRGIPEAEKSGADLILCGHTHNGQYFPCTLLTRYWYGKKYCHGISRTGGAYGIVSSGTGFFQVPVRVGTDSEVVLIRIRGNR